MSNNKIKRPSLLIKYDREEGKKFNKLVKKLDEKLEEIEVYIGNSIVEKLYYLDLDDKLCEKLISLKKGIEEAYELYKRMCSNKYDYECLGLKGKELIGILLSYNGNIRSLAEICSSFYIKYKKYSYDTFKNIKKSSQFSLLLKEKEGIYSKYIPNKDLRKTYIQT